MPLSADGPVISLPMSNPMPRPAVRFVALAALVLSVAVPFAASAGAAAVPRSDSMLALQADLLVQINDFRRSTASLHFVSRRSSRLRRARHSSEMAARGYFSHNSVNGSSFDRRIARFYLVKRGYWSVGENLLWSSPDVDAAHALQMWLNSRATART